MSTPNPAPNTAGVPESVHAVFPSITDAQWATFSPTKQRQLVAEAAQYTAGQATIANDNAHNSGLYGAERIGASGAATAAGDVRSGVAKAATLGVGATLGDFLGALVSRHTWKRAVMVLAGLIAVVMGAFLLNRDLLTQVAGSAVTNAAGAAAVAAV